MKKSRMFAAASAAVVSAAVLAVSASAYNAYIGLQTSTYSFRNSWSEATYGKDTPYFNSWIVWGNADTDPDTYPEYSDLFDYDLGTDGGYVLPASYTDTIVDSDGTYFVKAEGIDWDLKEESDFNLIFISTDIPTNIGATITNVNVYIDGVLAKTVNEYEYDDKVDYIEIDIANIWNNDVGGWGLAFPSDSVAIEFTVDGIGGKDAAIVTTGDVDAATDSSKGSPDTGIESVAVIGGLAVLAGAGIALTRKRK